MLRICITSFSLYLSVSTPASLSLSPSLYFWMGHCQLLLRNPLLPYIFSDTCYSFSPQSCCDFENPGVLATVHFSLSVTCFFRLFLYWFVFYFVASVLIFSKVSFHQHIFFYFNIAKFIKYFLFYLCVLRNSFFCCFKKSVSILIPYVPVFYSKVKVFLSPLKV